MLWSCKKGFFNNFDMKILFYKLLLLFSINLQFKSVEGSQGNPQLHCVVVELVISVLHNNFGHSCCCLRLFAWNMTCRYICYIMTPEESSFHRSVDGGRGCWLHRGHLALREPGLPSAQPHPPFLPALSQSASGQRNCLFWSIMPTTFRQRMVDWNYDDGGEGRPHLSHDGQRRPPSRRLLLSKHNWVDPEWWTVSPRLLSSAWKKRALLNWGAKQFQDQCVSKIQIRSICQPWSSLEVTKPRLWSLRYLVWIKIRYIKQSSATQL